MNRQESAPESVSSYVKDNLHPEVVRRHRSAPEPMTNTHKDPSSGSERPFDEMEDDPFAEIPNGVHPSSEHPQSKAARLSAIKIRRNVKQPVSYAEPALNTKLRRGDIYFTKPDEQHPQMVTPEQACQVDPALA
jgi:hypothetical protein